MKLFNDKRFVSVCVISTVMFTGISPAHAGAAINADAALALARQSGCMKCHSVAKEKEGPSFQKTAAKYKNKEGAEDRLFIHITTGEKAKFADGHEEEHKIIKSKDEREIRNLIQWILSN
jgi:cytochrome c